MKDANRHDLLSQFCAKFLRKILRVVSLFETRMRWKCRNSESKKSSIPELKNRSRIIICIIWSLFLIIIIIFNYRITENNITLIFYLTLLML